MRLTLKQLSRSIGHQRAYKMFDIARMSECKEYVDARGKRQIDINEFTQRVLDKKLTVDLDDAYFVLQSLSVRLD